MKTILIAAVASLMFTILCTPLVVAYFRRRGFGQEIRVDGPQTHLVKRGTPTMGGVAIIGSTVVGYTVAHLANAVSGAGSGPTASGVSGRRMPVSSIDMRRVPCQSRIVRTCTPARARSARASANSCPISPDQ